MKRSARTAKRPDWPALVTALGARLTVDALDPRAVAAISSRPAREPVAIACSGGADSVALVLVLLAAFPERRGKWLVLHFDHRLRGRASSEDAAFVRRLAEQLGEAVRVGAWTRPASIKQVAEDEARTARHAFFTESMKAAGARVIALGHHLDDLAETMLMRLTRGSGSAGLAAPRPVQRVGTITRVRPLLALPSASLRDLLRAIGAPWREDASNATDAYFRNRVRAHVLPALVAACPADALAGFALARRQLEDDDDALTAAVATSLPKNLRGACDLSSFVGRPRALVRRAVQAWVAANALDAHLTRPSTERLIEAIRDGGATRMSAGPGLFARTTGGRLSIERVRVSTSPSDSDWAVELSPQGGGVKLPDGATLAARTLTLTPDLSRAIHAGNVDPSTCAWLSATAVGSADLIARGRRSGDRWQPLGAPGAAKVQDMLVNRKIPRELRNHLPVITRNDGAILWIPGFPPANAFAVQAGSDGVVQLTYMPARAKLRR